jgi:hypothetical protein
LDEVAVNNSLDIFCKLSSNFLIIFAIFKLILLLILSAFIICLLIFRKRFTSDKFLLFCILSSSKSYLSIWFYVLFSDYFIFFAYISSMSSFIYFSYFSFSRSKKNVSASPISRFGVFCWDTELLFVAINDNLEPAWCGLR